MDIYKNLSSTKLDDDVKISVVLRECPQELRDHLLVNSQQFESNYKQLMNVDYISKSKGESGSNSKGRAKERARIAIKQRQKARSTTKAKAKEKLLTTKSVTCAGEGVIPHEIAGHEQTTERGGGRGLPSLKEYIHTIEHDVVEPKWLRRK